MAETGELGDTDNVIAQTVVNKTSPIATSPQKNIRVFHLKMMLNTNLPGMSEPTPFQFNMLYHPDLEKGKFSGTKYTLPYFTDTVKYPMDMLTPKLYSDRVDFFFNKTRFTKILRKTMVDYVDNMDTFDVNRSENDDDDDEDQPKKDKERADQLQENADHNIKCMLVLLFPIADELHNVFKTTYDQYILETTSPEIYTIRNIDPITFLNPSLFPLYNYFAPRKYEAPITEVSYLKYNNQKYIIADVIWQNDLINHPVYRKFVSVYYDKLQEKRNNYRKMTQQYSERKKFFVSLIEKHSKSSPNNNTGNAFESMVQSLIKNVSGQTKPRVANVEYSFDNSSDTKFNQKENTKRDILIKMIDYIGSIDDILKGYNGKLDGNSTNRKIRVSDLTKQSNQQLLDTIIENIVNAYIDYTNYNKDSDSTMKITLKDNTRILTELYNTAITLKTVRLLYNFITDNIRRLDLSETNDDGSSKTKLELDILRVLNQNYKYYVDLNIAISSSLKNVIEPLRRSSNMKLQSFLKQLASPSTAEVEDPHMLIDIYDKYISSVRRSVNQDYIKKYMNVGVSTIVSPESDDKESLFSGEMPEIYVYINVVSKDAYEKNENRRCMMADDRITNNLKQILYSNTMLDRSFPETNVYRSYDLLGNSSVELSKKDATPDIASITKSNITPNSASITQTETAIPSSTTKTPTGGKRRTRKYSDMRKIQTRRYRAKPFNGKRLFH